MRSITNCTPEQKSILDNNLRLNDEEFEIWKEYPSNKHYLVSSLGRVKYDGKILHQVEELNKNEQVKDGWVLLEQNPDIKVLKYYVYTLVAKTFLGKIDGDGYEVHHITNNGCDNSVNNLILLTKTQHSEVHRYKVGFI